MATGPSFPERNTFKQFNRRGDYVTHVKLVNSFSLKNPYNKQVWLQIAKTFQEEGVILLLCVVFFMLCIVLSYLPSVWVRILDLIVSILSLLFFF